MQTKEKGGGGSFFFSKNKKTNQAINMITLGKIKYVIYTEDQMKNIAGITESSSC